MISFVRNILETAADTIDRRASDRDVPQERSMAATVKAFNAIHGTNLTESQGWSFMVILKEVRSARGPYKEDDFVDGAAYISLQAEARSAEWEASRLQTEAEHLAREAAQAAGNEPYTS